MLEPIAVSGPKDPILASIIEKHKVQTSPEVSTEPAADEVIQDKLTALQKVEADAKEEAESDQVNEENLPAEFNALESLLDEVKARHADEQEKDFIDKGEHIIHETTHDDEDDDADLDDKALQL